MSKRVADITARDGLLDHWDIYHLHLGTEIDQRSGLIRRTEHILLCRFDDYRAYFIMVAPHGSRSPNAWYQQELIEIIHHDWPDSIDSARIKGVTGVDKRFNDEDIQQLRKANLNALFEVSDGTVYIGPGLGTTGDGTNVADIMFADRTVRATNRIEARIANELPLIREGAKQQGYHFKSPVTFVLWAVQFGDYWDILERGTNYRFRLDDTLRQRQPS